MTMARDATTAVDVRDARRTYNPRRAGRAITALAGVSISVDTGESLALLGPNGSGKSTLLRMIATLDAPDSGAVTVLGGSTRRDIADIRARIGVLFQSPSIDTLLTVRENLATHAALFGMRGRSAREAVESCAREQGIGDRLDDRAGELSGGLLRRADLARALVHDPELLVLDEPTTGLDPGARTAFLDAIESRRRERGLTVVMSTHLLDEASRADRVALLDQGRVVARGTRDQLCASIGAPLVIETDEAHADELERDGRTATRSRGRVRAAVDGTEAGRIADRLIARSAPVRVGPPTLEDVYEHLTGRPLEEAQTDTEAVA